MRAKKVLSAAAILSAAVANVVGFQHHADAATLTYTGSVADPNSAAYVLATTTLESYAAGDPIHVWNNAVQNWSTGGASTTYNPGVDSVVFTDNTASGKDFIRLATTMNPASMTFAHSGPGFTIY